MNVKGSYEQIAYPDLYFTIDNYEEAFAECVLRDSECLNIELTAYNRSGQVHGVCFLGTISYSTIKQFYDHLSHASRSNYHPITLSRHRNNRMTNSSYSSTSPILDYTSTQFMRVIGPQANGLVEIAIKPMQNMTQQLTLDLSKIDEINHTNFITKCCQPVCPSESEMEYNSADNWMLNDISCCMNKTVGSEVITQQPVIEPYKSTSFLDYYEFLPETYLNRITSNGEESEYLQNIYTDVIPTLRPSLWSVKSAGASVHTSPVRLSKRSVDNKCLTPSINQQEYSPVLNRKCKFKSVNTINLHRESRPSRISEILNAFTGAMTKPSLGSNNRTKSIPINPLNCAIKPNHNNLTSNIPLPTMCNNECNDQFGNLNIQKGHIYENPLTLSDRNNSSFGQAWSWFKEKRRATSIGFIASPTFIRLPCQNILVELLEVKREPILNFTNQ
ncbi:hypothetical protein EWB00_010974 [Schistosoma japonicum]|uniref:Uncharacterized protein n=2 Tax=Schistosoma japonicum TaxID=6182 RepID=A0A4Z2DMZ2_SCHJA|nr:hypothetical protein EWB00_010974 [Schistosoma japonicum]